MTKRIGDEGWLDEPLANLDLSEQVSPTNPDEERYGAVMDGFELPNITHDKEVSPLGTFVIRALIAVVTVFSLWAVFVGLTTSDGEGYTPTGAGCCVYCSVGKACGNTCIERSDACHVGSGCACDQ